MDFRKQPVCVCARAHTCMWAHALPGTFSWPVSFNRKALNLHLNSFILTIIGCELSLPSSKQACLPLEYLKNFFHFLCKTEKQIFLAFVRSCTSQWWHGAWYVELSLAVHVGSRT